MRKLLSFCILIIAVASLSAGAFGVEYGWNEREILAHGVRIVDKITYDDSLTEYEIVSPAPHQALPDYSVMLQDGTVSIICGMSADNIKQSEGLNSYHLLKRQLSNIYGNPYFDERASTRNSSTSEAIQNNSYASFWLTSGSSIVDFLVDSAGGSFLLELGLIVLYGNVNYMRSDDHSFIMLSLQPGSESGTRLVLFYSNEKGEDYVLSNYMESPSML